MPIKRIEIDLVQDKIIKLAQGGEITARPSFRTKDVCLSVQDWLDVGAELKQYYPSAVYVRRLTPLESSSESRPPLQINHQLSELLDASGERFAPDIMMGFDPNHRLDLKPAREATDWRRRNFGWIYNGMCLPRIRLMTGAAPEPADKYGPERMPGGRIEMSLEPKNENHLALARQFFGILRRHITKRPMRVLRYPGYVPGIYRNGGLDWIGKDALRWALEDTKRLLKSDMNPDGTGWGYRPAD